MAAKDTGNNTAPTPASVATSPASASPATTGPAPSDLKPYAAFALYRIGNKKDVKKTLDNIAHCLDEALKEKQLKSTALNNWEEGDVTLRARYVTECRQPSWLNSLFVDLKDEVHHLVLLMSYDKYFAVAASDSNLRALVTRTLDAMPLSKVPERELRNAFVNGTVLRALWLRGLHSPDDRKADSKVLYGPKVQQALNPMDDRSFMPASVRSEAVEVATGQKKLVVGVTPDSSYVWVGPTKSPAGIAGYFTKIVEHLKTNADATRDDIPILSKQLEKTPKREDVKEAFGFSFIAPETASNLTDEQIGLLEEWQTELRIDTIGKPTRAEFRLRISEGDQAYVVDVEFATWSVKPALKFNPDKTCVAWHRWPQFKAMLSRHNTWSVWFESGHSLVGGDLAYADVTIADFDGCCALDFNDFDISNEKPVQLDATGNKTKTIDFTRVGSDESLFSWWVNRGARAYLGSRVPQSTDYFALMLCDDGAGEIGDFILLVKHPDCATATNPSTLAIILVHIKSAGKLGSDKAEDADDSDAPDPAGTAVSTSAKEGKRQLAPKRFEEVLQQAVKNLSKLRLPELMKEIGDKLAEGKKPVWIFDHTGTANRISGPMAEDQRKVFLGAFKDKRYHREVVVVQPHQAYQHFLDEMQARHPKPRMRLLCTLLNTADAACRAESTRLQVVFRDDPSSSTG